MISSKQNNTLMVKVIASILIFVFATTSVVAEQDFNLVRFYDPFVDNGLFTAQLVVGDQAADVAAALSLSVTLQTRLTQGSVSAKAHTDYTSGDAIIITSGDIEPEFASVLSSCDIDISDFKRLATYCRAEREYLIVYGETNEDVMQVGRDLSGGSLNSEIYSISRAPVGSTSLEELLAQKTAEGQEDETTPTPAPAAVEENDAPNNEETEQEQLPGFEDKDAQEIMDNSTTVQQEKQSFVGKAISWLVGLFS